MRSRPLLLSLALTIGVTSCAKSPTTPAGSASVTTPALASPANGSLVANSAQPVTLTVNNGFVTASAAAVSYTFEVATDSGFTNVVSSKDVPQGAGQTSVKLDVLAAGRDYYWHARTKGDTTTGVFTAPLKFTIGAAVTLSAPVAVQPLAGASADPKPTLTVTNATRSGPTGTITYRFEISASSSFSTILASGTVPEGNGTTSFTPATSLAIDGSYFWHAEAVDASNSATSPFSTSVSFTTVGIDLTKVDYQRFVNISGWPITDQVRSVDQDGGDGHICIDHTMRGLWPTANFEDNPLVPVEATQWYFAKINGQWYGGAGEWLRPDQICKEGQFTNSIGPDGTWGGPMDTWVPKRGELVGYMISTPARAWPTWSTIDQRSNVVIQPWTINGINTP